MIRTKALLAGVVAAAACAAAARAADMPRSWDYERPPMRYVELDSGWYARGDLGYRFNHVGSVVTPNTTISSMTYLNTATLGIGGGYKYKWFRSDFTVDYGITSRAHASTTTGSLQPQYTAKFDTATVLGNVYLDLGTWSGFTPYIGGGAGMSYLRSKEYVNTALPIIAKATSSRTNLSWAAMTGVAYQINPNWVVDVGYRYLKLGDLPTSTGTSLPTDSTTWKQISAQEVRIGFRVLLH